jgi:hypothetical protein
MFSRPPCWYLTNLLFSYVSQALLGFFFLRIGLDISRAGYVDGIVIRLRPVESAAGTPLGARDLSVLQNVRTGSGAHLASCSMRSRVLYRGWNGRVMKLTTHCHLTSRLRLSGAIPLFPSLCLHSVNRENFTFFCLNLGYAYFLPQPYSLLTDYPLLELASILLLAGMRMREVIVR